MNLEGDVVKSLKKRETTMNKFKAELALRTATLLATHALDQPNSERRFEGLKVQFSLRPQRSEGGSGKGDKRTQYDRDLGRRFADPWRWERRSS